MNNAQKAAQSHQPQQQEHQLLVFAGSLKENRPQGLPFRLTDYLALVAWTGRILRDDKKGVIAENTPPILQRLSIENKRWLYLPPNILKAPFKGLIRSVNKLKWACQKLVYARILVIDSCRQYFPDG